jgi:multidrug efflux pump
MNLSSPFINRPIATTLLAVGLGIAGIMAFIALPVSPLPQIEFPTISVQAGLPGASPVVMATSVATPLERQLSRIAGITEMTSSSSLGSTRVTVQFELSRNIDGAARDVQAAINAARGQLPADLPSNPTYRKVNPSDSPVMIIALTSPIYTNGQMYDVASTILQQKLSQINGVGQVVVGGSSLPAVRVELNPTVLNKYGIDLEDVRKTLVEANVTQPKGQLTDGIRTSAIITNDQIFRAYEYQPLVIKYSNGAAIKMSDVAVVNDSVEDLRNAGMANGETSVLLVIFKQPGANVIGTVDRVRQMMPLLKASIPAAITMNIIMDRTTTIRASLFDVEMTLLMAMFLVIFVIYVFLKNVRSALIPSVTVPLSLLGTFCMMYLFGYTLDNLSLMALTIVTGFVVDDAVVVLENITRHIEAGMKPKEAALQGAQEVGFTVLSMSASLIAVFIPILLMTGIVGRLFREFAMTLSIAIFVSLIISLTVTPMMCAWLLKAETREHGKSARVTFTKRMQNGYEHSLSWVLDHQPLMLVVTIATIMINVGLFWVVPKGFFPQQDTGRISASIQAQQDISFQAMKQKLTSFVKIVGEDEAVENVSGFVGSGGGGGGSTTNAGSMYISLKPLAERGVMADTVINRLREKLVVPGATLYMQSAQDLVIGGRQGNAQFQYTLSAYNLEDLNIWVPRIMEQLAKLPGIADLNSDQLNHGLQVFLTVDRDTAARFGLTAQQIDNVLYDAFGQRQVSTMYSAMNQYHVVMEVEPRYWQRPETLNDIYMASSTGQRVPLSAFTHFTPSSTLLMVNHQNQFPSVTLSFNLLPGVALGDAVAMISNKINEMHLPPATLHGAFQGAAQAFQASLASQAYLIMATLIAVYIVLGILYESLIHPLTILSTLPSAGVGALLALQLTGTELSLIALIGIILLIGIVKKNAIMMIDFALHVERTEKKSPREAIYEACCLRFRPIMMTTMAALLSAFPLAFSHGVGSELRRPLGISIVGGLIVSQVLTLYTTPVIYLTLENYSQWCRQHWVRLVLRLKMTRSVQNS